VIRKVKFAVIRAVLRLFGKLPRRYRLLIVRTIKPNFVVGTIPFVFDEAGRVLLVRHSYREHWATPGGYINRREEAAQGAVREVLEEVALDIRLLGEPIAVLDPYERRVDLVFRAEPVRPEKVDSVKAESAELLDARWFAVDDLPKLQLETQTAWDALHR
jgi:8-oxo-dGTP pyrophosphatase MutT (NUDIX family)